VYIPLVKTFWVISNPRGAHPNDERRQRGLVDIDDGFHWTFFVDHGIVLLFASYRPDTMEKRGARIMPDEDNEPVDDGGMSEQDWEDHTNDLENQLVDALEDKALDEQ
jgi:hypothetical protein